MDINTLKSNIDLIIQVLAQRDPVLVHRDLDKLLNTTKILYISKEDFLKSFPAPDDTNGKINLVMSRRK